MLPLQFKEKMKSLLGEEYHDLVRALEEGQAVRGLRVNLCKTSTEEFLKNTRFDLIPTDYCDNGFILRDDIQIGNTPEHHSGLIYVQDPGAMATVSALDIEPDWWVADLCSAPGGKSSQIAERLGSSGFLLSNEYVPKRAKIIVGNFERLGIKNAIVTSMDTAELARLYDHTFDLVLADAPCSGEGMFRKSDEAIADWSEENVRVCAERQGEILNNAAKLVKGGGYLLYSTCTYSPEENEMAVSKFLAGHSNFHLAPVKEILRSNTRDGLQKYGSKSDNIRLCRRCYPHVTEGEGQFIALMRRDEIEEEKRTILYKDSSKPLTKQENEAVYKFFRDNLTKTPDGKVVKVGNNPVLIQHGCPLPPHSVFMSGILLGEIRGNMLHPSHQLFSALGADFIRKEELTLLERGCERYLAGEEIEASRTSEKGWCVLTYRGAPLGGGKISDGRIKNHYPKGLRIKQEKIQGEN